MADLLREAPFGQVVRFLTRNKYFQYPEEKPDFTCPHSYKCENDVQHQVPAGNNAEIEKKETSAADTPSSPPLASNPERLEENSDSGDSDLERQPTLGLQRTQTLPYTAERLAVERELAVERTKSRPIAPTKTADGTILVDWYSTDDPANPQNWSQKKKFLVAFLIE